MASLLLGISDSLTLLFLFSFLIAFDMIIEESLDLGNIDESLR